MTDTTALRDELARLKGYEPFYELHGAGTWNPPGDKSRIVQHPFPDGDLTALAGAWPEGWYWSRVGSEWSAVSFTGARGTVVEVPDTGDEYADRLALTVAVVKAAAS